MKTAEITFKNKEGKTATIEVSIKDLLDKTTEDFLDMLEDTSKCTSASCNNESQNFCDCEPMFDDYEFFSLKVAEAKQLPTNNEAEIEEEHFDTGDGYAVGRFNYKPKDDLFELSLFAEWIKTHAKHCEPDGWKDQDGLGATISSTDLAEMFKRTTIFEAKQRGEG